MSVRATSWLLAATAAATVAVELLVYWYAPEQGFGLAVRTCWALLRSLAFLLLIWHVRAGRAAARPFGLILAVTTVFAVGRLLVPRSGVPAWPGVVAFCFLAALCGLVVWVLYRSPALDSHLVRRPARRPVSPRILTARVAALAYTPLMLVPALAAIGAVASEENLLPPVASAWLVGLWLITGLVVGNVILLITFFFLLGHGWARVALVALTLGVLVIQLTLAWLLLGLDGLVRDGGPLVVAAALALWGAGTSGSRPSAVRQGG